MRKGMLCSVCGKAAENTCRMCGRPVCRSDFEEKSGMCNSCRRGRSIGSRS